MRIESARRLRGPNVYLSRPVLVARLHLAELTARESVDFDGFADRLLDAVPGLSEHHCATGAPGGFTKRLREGTYFGHVAEHVALELSVRIGREVSFGRTTYAGTPGRYDVILECPRDEPAGSTVGQRLLAVAISVVEQVLAGRRPCLEREVATAAAECERGRPGPSTAAIAAAARRRGIPVERVGELSLLRLGYGNQRRLVWAAMTDQTSAIGIDIAGDKQLTRQLLADAGVPVPPGGPARGVDEALALFAALGPPVVVKPRHGRQGRHVHLGVDSPEAVRAACAASASADADADAGAGAGADGGLVVERQLGGRDYRVLVVGGRMVAAAERVPAHVVGDGVTDITGLVARGNLDPRRGAGHSRPLTTLVIDDLAGTVLHRQGRTAQSVPADGEVVWLRDTANISTGGTGRDVTAEVHPDVVAVCQRAAAIIGLDVAGIDLRLADIAAPLPVSGPDIGVGGGIIEVNAAPGLRMHLHPSAGQPRDVAAAIVDSLYPPGAVRHPAGAAGAVRHSAGATGRIPTIAVTGTNGKTTTARLAAHVLAGTGRTVGLTTTDGVYVDGALVQRADATGPRSAQVVLGDPTVAIAVLETARGGMLRQGLGYDWTDVGVVTNIGHDHLGQDGLDTVDDIADVKSLVAERVRDGGTLVLNADDPRVVQLVARPRVRAAHKRVVWFSLDDDNPLVVRHRSHGGSGFLLSDDWLVEATGDRSQPLLAVRDLPGAFGGAARYVTANALAAAAATCALGVPASVVGDRLRSFQPWAGNPGRGALLRLGQVDVFVDYAHNPAAISAVTEVLHRIWGRARVVAAVTLPGDRRDDLLRESARVVAEGFDRVVLYSDADPRGRAPGEVTALVGREIQRCRPDVACTTVDHLEQAVPAALASAGDGDVVLLLYEKIEPVLELLGRLGAVPVAEPARGGQPARRPLAPVTTP